MLPNQLKDYQPDDAGFQGDSYINREKLKEAGISEFKCEPGQQKLLFVPTPKFERYWGRQVIVHYRQGIDGSNYLCPYHHSKEFLSVAQIAEIEQAGGNPSYCPVCAKYKYYMNEVGDKERAAIFWKRFRTLYWIFDMRTTETVLKGPQLYDAPRGREDGTAGIDTALRKFISLRYCNIFAFVPDEIAQRVTALSPEAGSFVFSFERSGKGPKDTSYMILGFEPAPFLLNKELVEKAKTLPSIDTFLSFRDGAYIERKMGREITKKNAEIVPTAAFAPTPVVSTTGTFKGNPVETVSKELEKAFQQIEKTTVNEHINDDLVYKTSPQVSEKEDIIPF